MIQRPSTRALAGDTVFSVLLALLALAAAPALAADATNGETLFRAYCATCHSGGQSRSSQSALAGAGNPGVIQSAFKRIEAMRPLHGVLGAADVDDIASYLAERAGTKTPGTVNVVEYYHPWFDHYFVTALYAKIAKLDDGTIHGWVRTHRQFKVHALTGTGLAPVCRFFGTAFDAKSSHFYTPSRSECLVVKTNPKWRFEGTVFHVAVPDLNGACPPGTNPLYRLYNKGRSGAPNHRLTTDLGVREGMLGQGWVAEGYGPRGVSMCIPP